MRTPASLEAAQPSGEFPVSGRRAKIKEEPASGKPANLDDKVSDTAHIDAKP